MNLITGFRFYEDTPIVASEGLSFKQANGAGVSIGLQLDHATALNRRGYGDSLFRFLTIEVNTQGLQNNRHDFFSPARFSIETRRISYIKSLAPKSKAGIIFITLCNLAETDSTNFLKQFSSASSFMAKQPGFCSARLYKERPHKSRATFVNIAIWSHMDAFTTAFGSDEFKNIITSGFETKSQIMLSHIQPKPERQHDCKN